MEDKQIIQMFLNREESAIQEIDKKYNQYCFKIAWNILNNREDSEECVNDTWFRTWNYIPPKKPMILSSFIGKITRGLAIDCLRKKYAAKRPDLHMADIETETSKLDSIVANTLEEQISEKELFKILNGFLWELSESDRDIFLRRYWHIDTIKEIAFRHGKTEGSIKNSLYRNRKKLYKLLKKEGVSV
ncbi:MAG: sigma-70 family RNA polymerase sigma factor [Lachnospiraceae bacterium]